MGFRWRSGGPPIASMRTSLAWSTERGMARGWCKRRRRVVLWSILRVVPCLCVLGRGVCVCLFAQPIRRCICTALLCAKVGAGCALRQSGVTGCRVCIRKGCSEPT